MKINTKLLVETPNAGETLELKQVVIGALNALLPKDTPPPTHEDAYNMGRLSHMFKHAKNDVVEITPEEAALIRGRLPFAWVPFIVYTASELLKEDTAAKATGGKH